MNKLNDSIILKIADFCTYEQIIALSQLDKYHRHIFSKYLSCYPSKETINNYLENIPINRCWFCGALFKTRLYLYMHLKSFPNHMLKLDNMLISLTSHRYTHFFKLNSVEDYSCIYGNCNCLSKAQYLDLSKVKNRALKIITKVGHMYIIGIENFGNPIDRDTNILYVFYCADDQTKFNIIHFNNHYWIQLDNMDIDILPITEFKYYDIKIKYWFNSILQLIVIGMIFFINIFK